MEGRLFLIGLALGAYARAAARWGGSRPQAWRRAFGALAAAAAALILLPGYLGAETVGWPDAREWAAASVAALFGFLWVRLAKPEDGPSEEPLAEPVSWAEAVASAALLAALAMAFLVQAFRIPSASMEDTLRAGDRLFVNKAVYGLRLPFLGRRVLALGSVGRGDVLVFRFPSDDPAELHCTGPQSGKDYVKRVIGLPGDRVEVRDGVLLLNGTQAGAEPYAKHTASQPCARPPAALSAELYQKAWEERRLDQELGEGLRDHFGPVTVPPGSYLVMGDNRDGSCDSRFWGPVPERFIKGRAGLLYWPPSRVGFVK